MHRTSVNSRPPFGNSHSYLLPTPLDGEKGRRGRAANGQEPHFTAYRVRVRDARDLHHHGFARVKAVEPHMVVIIPKQIGGAFCRPMRLAPPIQIAVEALTCGGNGHVTIKLTNIGVIGNHPCGLVIF